MTVGLKQTTSKRLEKKKAKRVQDSLELESFDMKKALNVDEPDGIDSLQTKKISNATDVNNGSSSNKVTQALTKSAKPSTRSQKSITADTDNISAKEVSLAEITEIKENQKLLEDNKLLNSKLKAALSEIEALKKEIIFRDNNIQVQLEKNSDELNNKNNVITELNTLIVQKNNELSTITEKYNDSLELSDSLKSDLNKLNAKLQVLSNEYTKKNNEFAQYIKLNSNNQNDKEYHLLLEQKLEELLIEKKSTVSQIEVLNHKIEVIYKDNLKLKDNLIKLERKQPLYGAADRIRNQLQYKLGATMIEHSKDLKGVITLPVALYEELCDFLEINIAEKQLPEIDEYEDAKDAEKIKEHLSYKLGEVMLKNSKSLSGLLKLPIDVKTTIVEFKRKKKQK